MNKVRAKKHLGQHFLTDLSISEKIADCLDDQLANKKVIEIGPGTGSLTQFLFKKDYELTLIELDRDSVSYLKKNLITNNEAKIIEGDFLKLDVEELFGEGNTGSIVGNFPYNISSQIFFKVLDYRDNVDEVVCMLQKEVAKRIASPPGSKVYGILSVLLQAYYDITYEFTVPPHVFDPPPKVDSGVIRLKRNNNKTLSCNQKLFKRVVKQGFNNRRKTLRNSLKSIITDKEVLSGDIYGKRAEQLSVSDFEMITNHLADFLV